MVSARCWTDRCAALGRTKAAHALPGHLSCFRCQLPPWPRAPAPCLLPQFLPRRYDYSRPVPPSRGGGDIETGEGGGRECVICMQASRGRRLGSWVPCRCAVALLGGHTSSLLLMPNVFMCL